MNPVGMVTDCAGDQDFQFRRGFAAALACLIRDCDQPTMAFNIAKSNGYELRHFTQAKVDAFDLKPIRKMFREESPAHG